MTTRSILVAAALATIGFASVASEGSEGPQSASVQSREQVRAEVLAARRAGTLLHTHEGVSLKPQALTSQRSRAEVMAEAVRAARTSRTSPVADALYHHGG